jgi:hypothetical protein
LEFSYTETGAVRIAVPERLGHDDRAMSLLHACSVASDRAMASWANPGATIFAQPWEYDAGQHAYRTKTAQYRAKIDAGQLDVVRTGNTDDGGLIVPRAAVPMGARETHRWWQWPPGTERDGGW